MSDVAWLVLTFTLPTKQASQRVGIWQNLQQYGSVPLGNSGHLLPSSPVNEERFQWQGTAIRKHKYDASVVRVESIDNISTPQLIGRFAEARARVPALDSPTAEVFFVASAASRENRITRTLASFRKTVFPRSVCGRDSVSSFERTLMNSTLSSIVLGAQDKRQEVPGFVLTETFRPPDLVLPAHFHEHANIGLTLQGSFIETIGKDPYEVNPSSVIFRPAAEKHANRYGKTAAHCLIIEVRPQRLTAIRQVTRILDRSSCVEGGLISNLALRILREFRTVDAVAPLSIEALTLELLVEAARLECGRDRNPPRWLRQAEEFIRERFSESLSLSSVAEVAGVHAAHLAKMFRRHYGSTVGEYIRRLRLDRAARLLSQSDETVSAIGLATGFYDQSHFAHLFRARFGMPPQAFRASYGKKKQALGRSTKENTPN